jgi:four helix bundle protein
MGSRDQGTERAERPKNGPVRSFRDLVAWQKAYQVGLMVYAATRSFPADERFGLVTQLRRSAVSVASNIAEGYGRGGRTDYSRFLKIARGSLYEVDTQLMFSKELGYLPIDDYEPAKAALDECERVLAGLIRAIDAVPPTT